MPVMALLLYFHMKDKGAKEPKKLVLKVFLGGVMIVIPVAALELLLMFAFGGLFPGILGIAVKAFLLVALVEEFGKLMIVDEFAYEKKAFDEVMDGVTYCILASMGFAVFENFSYVFLDGGSFEIGLLRAVTAIPAHALFSGIMGYYIGLSNFAKNNSDRVKLRTKGLWAATLLHGFYDFVLFTETLWGLLILPLILIMIVILHRLMARAHDHLLPQH